MELERDLHGTVWFAEFDRDNDLCGFDPNLRGRVTDFVCSYESTFDWSSNSYRSIFGLRLDNGENERHPAWNTDIRYSFLVNLSWDLTQNGIGPIYGAF